jgi:hypothetical protein
MILQPVSIIRSGLRGIRENVFLVGAYDAVNREFLLPEAAVQDPPKHQVKVYHSGRRLLPEEYSMCESFPGSGYDKVRLIFAPHPTSRLYADYYVVV